MLLSMTDTIHMRWIKPKNIDPNLIVRVVVVMLLPLQKHPNTWEKWKCFAWCALCTTRIEIKAIQILQIHFNIVGTCKQQHVWCVIQFFLSLLLLFRNAASACNNVAKTILQSHHNYSQYSFTISTMQVEIFKQIRVIWC